MTFDTKTKLLSSTVLALTLAAAPVAAERILRADEVAVGEIDPAK